MDSVFLVTLARGLLLFFHAELSCVFTRCCNLLQLLGLCFLNYGLVFILACLECGKSCCLLKDRAAPLAHQVRSKFPVRPNFTWELCHEEHHFPNPACFQVLPLVGILGVDRKLGKKLQQARAYIHIWQRSVWQGLQPCFEGLQDAGLQEVDMEIVAAHNPFHFGQHLKFLDGRPSGCFGIQVVVGCGGHGINEALHQSSGVLLHLASTARLGPEHVLELLIFFLRLGYVLKSLVLLLLVFLPPLIL
mmetsp:Transcript_1597/g.5576  ORF Transcript_1597/g.5576 Transcript_1597/m.5576 type:complete len:247 (-) Transcript_1597:539-1279(-)